MDVWPDRATFRPGEPVSLTVTGDRPVAVEVSRLGRVVHRRTAGPGSVVLGEFEPGGYAVWCSVASPPAERAVTAFDVLDSPLRRPRYGFLSAFEPDRPDRDAAMTSMRQLHLGLVQFYDWMYRHHDLVPETDEFVDPLGRPLSMVVVRDLVRRVRESGALPLAYAAVYAAGESYANAHPEQLLYHEDGKPWMLADFLWITNLDSPWRHRLLAELRAAVDQVGFAGLHLDQYGDPKTARDDRGGGVDLADQFPRLIADIRSGLPDATLIFNNVNDFPTWATVGSPQDATYIEVWPPHTEYRHLVELVEAAVTARPDQPVILAAYLEPFAEAESPGADWAARLALATVFSRGGHYLLCGEDRGVLVDPYYPKFRRVSPAQHALLRRYFDFAVACGDLLYDPEATTVTGSHFGGINDDVEVIADTPVSGEPLPGHLWVTVRRSPFGLTVHLIDLAAQTDAEWNAAKAPGSPRSGLRLRVRRPGDGDALVGSPEAGPALRTVPAPRAGDHVEIAVPEFVAWTLVHLPSPARAGYDASVLGAQSFAALRPLGVVVVDLTPP